ncbi:MAG TPA: ATP synthase F1 subunit delta [Acidimicrobiales bacterium]|nr:ATP synthase F1 subunit delta [Acidimicrobiales bacterium]
MSAANVVARIYAQALYDIGAEKGSLAQLDDELQAVRDVIAQLDPDLRTFIEMPQFPRDAKWQVIRTAFDGKVSHDVLGLLHVLISRRREKLVADVAFEFSELVNEGLGRVHADVITAKPLDDELLAALRRVLEESTRREVVLDMRVDPAMIGGVRLSLGDLVVDGTTRRALHDLRRSLAASLV